jgi:hypothetical protein
MASKIIIAVLSGVATVSIGCSAVISFVSYVCDESLCRVAVKRSWTVVFDVEVPFWESKPETVRQLLKKNRETHTKTEAVKL